MRETSNSKEDAGGPPSTPLGPVNPIVRDADVGAKAAALHELASSRKPAIDRVAAELHRALGVHSEVSVKAVGAILGKPFRADVQRRRPGMDVEHVRDALRFRSRVDWPEQIAEIVGELRRQAASGAFEILKIDADKMAEPRVWGWRAVMVDMRLPDGLLVEYYVTFGSMIDASERQCHALYEQGRAMTPDMILADPAALRRLVEQSAAEYQTAWRAAAERIGATVEELEVSVAKVLKSLDA